MVGADVLAQVREALQWGQLIDGHPNTGDRLVVAIAALDGCIVLTADEAMRTRGHLFWAATRAEVEDSLETCDCLALLTPKEQN